MQFQARWAQFVALLTVGVAFCVCDASAKRLPPDRPPGDERVTTLTPMVLYLAKGEDNACGEGCNEWIAAEGSFDADAEPRLRKFLDRIEGRKLPIFFNSPGGIVAQAMAVGRLLREREMTAGVAQTVPQACAGAEEQACGEAKRSGRALASELQTTRAHCNSACIYALIGAKVRQVLPGSRLGIHSDRLVRIYADGRIVAPDDDELSAHERAKMEQNRAQLRRYVIEMGLSPDLVDAATKVAHEAVHVLSRDEVARYGIDAQDFRESRWALNAAPLQSPSILKFISELKGNDPKEYRTSYLRLSCGGGDSVQVDYIRALASFETGVATTVMIGAGERKFLLSRRYRFALPNIQDLQTASIPLDFFAAAAQGPAIEVTEWFPSAGGPASSRVTRLSTAGLAQAIERLRPTCAPEA